MTRALAAVGLTACVLVVAAGAWPAVDVALTLREPADVAVVGREIVVSDRRANAVYRLDAATGGLVKLATVAEARELAPAGRDAVLVSSGARILRIDLRSGAVTPAARAAKYILGLVRSPTGQLYVSEDGATIARIDLLGRRTVVARGLDGVHGLLLRGTSLLAAEAYAGNVIAIDVVTSTSRRLSRGLGNPSFLAAAPSGGLYISEFGADRIALRRTNGSLKTVARLAQVGPIALEARGTLLAATLDGRLVRIAPATGRITQLVPAASG